MRPRIGAAFFISHGGVENKVRIRQQNCREAPKQAVAIPIGRADIISGASGGDQHEFFRVQRFSAAKEVAEKQVYVENLVQSGASH